MPETPLRGSDSVFMRCNNHAMKPPVLKAWVLQLACRQDVSQISRQNLDCNNPGRGADSRLLVPPLRWTITANPQFNIALTVRLDHYRLSNQRNSPGCSIGTEFALKQSLH